MAKSPQLAIVIVLLATVLNLSLVTSYRFMFGACHASGYLKGKTGHCNRENDSDCCEAGKMYPQYRCSPPTTGNTQATMTINSFARGGDGGGPSECDNKYHSDSELVVALSTGWYDGGSRCLNYITINANGKSVQAKVVDECDSVNGCDSDHDFQPPCPNNIVDASPAVWKALDIPKSQVGDYDITWSMIVVINCSALSSLAYTILLLISLLLPTFQSDASILQDIKKKVGGESPISGFISLATQVFAQRRRLRSYKPSFE